MAVTTLPSITREYTLSEIARMTRAAPAKLLGLTDRGHLGAGAVRGCRASIEIAKIAPKCFAPRLCVFKDGELVVRDGEVTHYRFGRALHCRAGARPRDRAADADYYDERYGLPSDFMRVPESAIARPEPFEIGAMPELTVNGVAHRRHVRGSFRHARDRGDHHRRTARWARQAAVTHDGFRHLGDRLRLRGRRSIANCTANRRRTGARRARAAVCGLDRRAAEAAASARRAMRAHKPRFGLLRRARGRGASSSSATRCVISATVGRSPSGSAASTIGAFRSWTASLFAKRRPA